MALLCWTARASLSFIRLTSKYGEHFDTTIPICAKWIVIGCSAIVKARLAAIRTMPINYLIGVESWPVDIVRATVTYNSRTICIVCYFSHSYN